MRRHLLYIVVLSTAVACSSHKTTMSHADNPENSDPSQFEAVKDPAVNAETYFAAGQLAESQGQMDRAVAQYREALKVDPKQRNAMFRVAVIYTQSKQFDLAVATWKNYIEITDRSCNAYSNLGLCFAAAGKFKEAELAFQNGVKREPANEACRVNYGLMLARVGREEEAIEQLSVVLKPGDVHYNLASAYEEMGKKEQAKAEYQKALELNPQLWEARTRISKLD